MTRRFGLAGSASAAFLAAILLAGADGRPGAAAEVEEEDEEAQLREVYIPHPEFQTYYDRDQLAVEQVTLVRVRRPDQSEALVAKEESGLGARRPRGVAAHLLQPGEAAAPAGAGPARHRAGVVGRRALLLRLSRAPRAGDPDPARGDHPRRGTAACASADLDQDGALELIACDSRFAYAFDLPFAESPLVPVVYTFRDRAYAADNRRFPQVYQFRLAQERRRLAEAERAHDARGARRAVLSLLLHGLYAGRVTEAWCGFDRAYRWADRTDVRQEVTRRLRLAPDPEDGRLPPIDLGYALAPPGRCR